MSTFVAYQDEVEVIGLPVGDGDWHDFDLEPFLADPTAKAVVLRGVYGSGTTPMLMGFRGINDNLIWTTPIVGPRYINTCVSLAGGTTIQVSSTVGSTPKAFIIGEVHDAVIHSAGINLLTKDGEWNLWIDRQPTLVGDDVLNDIGAVIVRTIVNVVDTHHGIRERGSGDPSSWQTWDLGSAWFVIGLNENGYYQTLTSGKVEISLPYVNFVEVGYILKSSGVVTVRNVKEEAPPVNYPDWDILDLSATVQPIDEGAFVVGYEWYNYDGTPRHTFGKAVGSADVNRSMINVECRVTQMVPVNSARQIEYRIRDPITKLYIMWWEGPLATAVDAEAAIRSEIKTRAFAGPAVDTGADAGPAVGATAFAGPAIDAGATIRPAFRGRGKMGVN